MKNILMHFAEWMNIGAHEPIRDGHIDAYLEGAKVETKPLEWEKTGVSSGANTALGFAEVYEGFPQWRLDIPKHDLQLFDSAQEAKEEMQRLHNEQVIAWLG